MMFQCQIPSYEYFESIVRQQARNAPNWTGFRYWNDSLNRVRLVDGDVCSGFYSVRGSYQYQVGNDGPSIWGWMIFRFRNGNLDCIVYDTSPNLCQTPAYD